MERDVVPSERDLRGGDPVASRLADGAARGAALARRNGHASMLDALAALGDTGTVPLDVRNTLVSFGVRWFGVVTVRGVLTDIHGAIHLVPGDPMRASASVEIGLDSVRTGIALRDRHLRRALFLDTGRAPAASFRGGSLMAWPTHCTLPGSLTLRGITRTEELRCTVSETPSAVVPGGKVVVLQCETTLSRRAYGIGVKHDLGRYNPLLAAIGDAITIGVRIDLTRG
jgi:polyisoprenoid-binding protein YceI